MNTSTPNNRESDAVWKDRFRAPAIFWARSAQNAPQRGLLATNR